MTSETMRFIRDRVFEELQDRNVKAVAKATGLSVNTVSSIKTGRNKTASDSTIFRLENYLLYGKKYDKKPKSQEFKQFLESLLNASLTFAYAEDYDSSRSIGDIVKKYDEHSDEDDDVYIQQGFFRKNLAEEIHKWRT